MGIRDLFVLDCVAPQVPPRKDSARDIGLLRAANQALRRRQEDIEDAFLFVVYGACDEEATRRTLSTYGFPCLEVRFVGEDEALHCDPCLTLDEAFAAELRRQRRKTAS